MRPIRDRSSTITWQECCPTSKPKSSGAPIRPKDSSYCPGAGSLNAPSPGSTAVEDLPRTGRTSIVRASHSCALPQSASCCENSVIPLDVLGQTLINPGGRMNARDDENYYRGLFESAQKGIENAKAFLEAVGTSEAALKNVAMGLAIVKHPLP